MNKRFLLTVVICGGLVVAWMGLTKKFGPPPKAPEQAQSATPKPAEQAQSSAASTTIPAAKHHLVVESPGLYKATLSEQGFDTFQLEEQRYYTQDAHVLQYNTDENRSVVQVRKGLQPTQMISTYEPSLTLGFPNSDFEIPADAKWTLTNSVDAPCGNHPSNLEGQYVVPEKGCTLMFATEIPGKALIQKSLHFQRHSYQVDGAVEITNKSTEPLKHHVSLALAGFQDPTQKVGTFKERVPINGFLWGKSGDTKKASYEDVKEKNQISDNVGIIGHISIGQQYFIQALALSPTEAMGDKKASVLASPEGRMHISVEFSQQTIKPGTHLSYPFAYYAGPKIPEKLQAVSVSGQPVELEKTIDYTLGIIARPLLWMLRQIHNVIPNWAISIVLLTLLVKLVTLYPSWKSSKSMKSMSDLKPQLDALKEKYGEDKQKFNQEVMALYKRNGVNPLGGCLPMLLQMPVYFALYSMLGNAVELYNEPLITTKWIHDLTASDPFYILPLLTGAAMFLQSKMTPTPSADQNQKIMTYSMPVVFTLLGIFMPAGLTLYILTNTLLGVAQQVITNRMQKKPTALAKK